MNIIKSAPQGVHFLCGERIAIKKRRLLCRRF